LHSRVISSTELYTLKGASYDETEILKRATIAPRLDFIVLPLVPACTPELQKAIRSKISFDGYRGIIHVQIEADGGHPTAISRVH
jgi:hypothetical protein